MAFDWDRLHKTGRHREAQLILEAERAAELRHLRLKAELLERIANAQALTRADAPEGPPTRGPVHPEALRDSATRGPGGDVPALSDEPGQAGKTPLQ